MAGSSHEAREIVLGGMITRLRQYMSFMTDLLSIVLLFLERTIEWCPRVETTLALSSWTPLIRFVRAAKM
jgi:hypothetical protein